MAESLNILLSLQAAEVELYILALAALAAIAAQCLESRLAEVLLRKHR
jgi:hypothetical protein